VTLAFAVCWLPIHILELMNCAKSSLLQSLIQSYPKILYSIRAFTHALAYFNSCLNPYLYALLNRNFCIDLVNIMPSWRPCCEQSTTLENGHSHRNSKGSTTIISSNRIFLLKKHGNHFDDYEDESGYPERQTTNDVSCQVELLGTESKNIRLT